MRLPALWLAFSVSVVPLPTLSAVAADSWLLAPKVACPLFTARLPGASAPSKVSAPLPACTSAPLPLIALATARALLRL